MKLILLSLLRKTLIISVLIILNIQNLVAQLTPLQEWTNSTGTQNYFMRSKTVTDGSGNVYVAGATVNGNGNYDILVSKFNSGGALQWSQQKDGLANFMDAATALYVDGSGNVYITGFITDTLFHGTDVVTIKYNSSGVEQWVTPHNGVGNFHDFGSDIYVDGSGNVFVVGTCQNATPNADFMVIKYNSSGVRQWINTFNYNAANLDDAAARIKSVSAGKITVAGVIQLSSNTYAYGHLSYNMSTGAIIGSLVMGTSSTYIEREFAYTKDNDGNTYLAGAIDNGVGYGLDYCIIKFDTSAAIVWERHYNGTDGLEDIATDVAVDDDGNVYVTGYSTTSAEATNYTTLKFNSAGTQIWEQHFNGEGNGADTAMAITMHSDTTFVITGSSFNGSNQDYYTIKYDTTGTKLWEINYNSYYNKGDAAYCIAVDTLNAIIVTGQSYNDTAFSFTTIKYSETDPYLPPDFNSEEAGFINYLENKGQLLYTDLNQANEVMFYNQREYPNVFITNDRCSFLFHSIDTLSASNDTLHRIDMRFIESSYQSKIHQFEKIDTYTNFFEPHLPNGAINLKSSKRLIQSNIYPKIDLHYYSNENGIKMYFIINPGGDPADIRFRLDSATTTTINGDGTLTIQSLIDSMVLDVPEFYQDSLSNIIARGGGGYSATGNPNEYVFNIPSYNHSYPLIIQLDKGNSVSGAAASYLNLTWSTFVGGSDSDVYEEVAKDVDENVLACGNSNSTNFPITAGSAISSTNPFSLSLAVISKFNRANGHLDYSTYFGGTTAQCSSVNTHAYSIAADLNNNIYVAGITNTSNMDVINNVGGPILQSTNNSSTGSCNDLFIMSLVPAGNFPRFCTYWGGSADEIPNALYVDSTSHLQIGGRTYSSDFPVTTPYLYPGTYYSTVGDGFLMDMQSNGDTAWVTYFPAVVNDIAIANNNRIFITGVIFSSYSDSLPIYNPYPSTSYCDSTAAGYDSFVACLDASKAIKWCSFIGGGSYMGSASGDQGVAIAYFENEIVIAGNTYSGKFVPLLAQGSEYIDSTYGFGSSTFFDDVTITKFSTKDMTLLWSTYYGGNDQDYVFDVAYDKNHNIYLSGFTNSTSGSFSLVNYLSSWFDIYKTNREGFILAFNESNERFWSTYFGGSNDEFPKSLLTTNYDQLFLGGYSYSPAGAVYFEFPITYWNSQAWYDPTLAGSDAFITLFDLTNFPVSVNEQEAIESGFSIGLYPNPNNGNFNLVFNQPFNNKVTINVFNAIGQVVYQKSIKNVHEKEIIEVSVNNLSAGIYLVTVDTEMGMFTSKILVK